MDKINVAIIGFGMAGRELHIPPILNNNKYIIKKIMTRNIKSQEYIKDNYPNIEIITNYNDAISDSNIDLVVIATSNDVHYEYTKSALLNNKHVVCEKPFVETKNEAEELFSLARKNNLILRVFHNREYDGDILTVEEMIKSKKLGKLVSFEARFDVFNNENMSNWRYKDSVMKGAFYDLAPHLVHHAVRLFGLPKSVSNNLFYERENAIADDHFEMILKYDESFNVLLGSKQLERFIKPKLDVVGLNGTYVKYGFDKPDSTHFMPDTNYQENHTKSIFISNDLVVEDVDLLIGRQYMFYENLANDIINKIRNSKDEELAIAVVFVMELAIKSSLLKKEIEIYENI